MGMFDTVHFPQPVACVACEAQITNTQTKAFECELGDFHVGDCIGHAEELRIVRERLFCDECNAFDKQFVYFVVYRGILVDVALDLPTAEAQLRSFSFEKLILWYHDQYVKRIAEQNHSQRTEHFLYEVMDWYKEGSDQITPESQRKHRFFVLHQTIFKQAADPVAAIQAYLARQKEDSSGTETDAV